MVPLLNIDLGELPEEPEELYRLTELANLACGGHAGDRDSMLRSLGLCARSGAQAGAHPSYVDREHFGRRALDLSPALVRAQVHDQLSILLGCAQEAGVRLGHVKAHGALYHSLNRDPELAAAFLTAVTDVLGDDVLLLGAGGGGLEAAVRATGGRFAREQFADRGLRADGSLIPRSEAGALLTDPMVAAAQARRLVSAGQCETLCIHGDTPGAVEIARAVRAELESRR